MDDDHSKATGRSPGGRTRSTRPERLPVLTEIVMVRITKADRIAFEEAATENDWTVSSAIRILARRSLKKMPNVE